MTPQNRQKLALAVAATFAIWALVALVRATSWAADRPETNLGQYPRMWKLGGPQAEVFRDFLTTNVTTKVEPRGVVIFDPQTTDTLDALSLLGWCNYLMPHNRIVGVPQMSALDPESDWPRYLLRYPTPGQDMNDPKLELLSWTEKGSLYRFAR